MIAREIEPVLKRLAAEYPVVTVTGPRQSGKTTLCQMAFPDADYVSMEALDSRQLATDDPRGFLAQFKNLVILDEIQRAPSLLSYIQGIVDREDRPGMYILTGSAQFEMLDSVAQSLAGRTALLKLLPFSFQEVYRPGGSPDLEEMLFTGFYPRIHDRQLNPAEALSFYVETYIQRDVRALLQVRDMAQFERFVQLCAGRTGQLVNLSGLGNDCGVTHNTARAWLSVLEASYLVYLLKPHFANFNKRLIRAPKLYFCDVGLAAHLLGIEEARQLSTHPLRGALFETYVVGELLKQRFNRGQRSNLYFFRDNAGHEIDVLLDFGQQIFPVEIKAGRTIASDFFRNLAFYRKLNSDGTKGAGLVYGGLDRRVAHDTQVVGYPGVQELYQYAVSQARG